MVGGERNQPRKEHTMNAARLTENTPGTFLVIFGCEYRGEFIVSHAKPSRTYTTRKGAERAAAQWMAA
jgi:hypothetical protein